jgi:hypothetical protein
MWVLWTDVRFKANGDCGWLCRRFGNIAKSDYYDMIWYDMIYQLQLGVHPVAVVQYTFTHKQYTEQHNDTEYTEYYIHNNKNT